jgi:trk system potassium uptake protein TrkA
MSTNNSESLRVVIAGGGRVGFRAAQLLEDYGHDVAVIESGAARYEQINEHLPTVIEGDATRSAVLREADPAESDVIAALSEDAATNLAICLAAQHINESLYTVLRTDTETGEEYVEFVDAIASPERAGARLAANEIVGQNVRSIEGVTGNLEILEVQVAENAPAAGERLEDIELPEGSLVISDATANIARPDTVLEPDRHYTTATEPDVLDEVIGLLRG